jgi:uncharacterized protein YndB with AHSA1/START domain
MEKIRDEKVDFNILVRAAPERVFDALATANGLNEWFTQASELDPRPGGQIVFHWKEYGLNRYTGEYPGKVLEWVRPERYVYQWEADSRGYFTTVQIDFTRTGEGTLLHLVETGYKDTPAGMQDLLNRVSGWASVLTEMKYYLEHGVRY